MRSKIKTTLAHPIRIALTQGLHAVVDEADFDRLSQYRWHAVRTKGSFYARRSAGGAQVYMHHDVLGVPPSGLLTDHRNGDGLDNRRSNLRHATYSQNNANVSTDDAIRGVHPVGRKFMARISSNGRNHYAGLFGCIEQAACAADALMRLHHGDFARLNNIRAANDG